MGKRRGKAERKGVTEERGNAKIKWFEEGLEYRGGTHRGSGWGFRFAPQSSPPSHRGIGARRSPPMKKRVRSSLCECPTRPTMQMYPTEWGGREELGGIGSCGRSLRHGGGDGKYTLFALLPVLLWVCEEDAVSSSSCIAGVACS